MKRLLFAIFMLVSINIDGVAQEKKVDVAAELRSIVSAERAFAKLASERGTRTAFLANMTDDACVFGKGAPENGKKVWTERTERPGLLSWEPVYADVARSGEMGWTTGPWEFRPKAPEDKPIAFGQFITVWAKQPDGSWKWVLDTGISHPPREGLPPSLEFARDFRQNTDKDKLNVNVEKTKSELLKIERRFAADSAKDTLAAYLTYVADDVRILREGIFPVVGKSSVEKALAASPGTFTWTTLQAGAARSGEFGYTLGTYELKRAAEGDKASSVERGSFVRVWKKRGDGRWRVVLDIINAAPPAATKTS